jgi:hypothetical protein
MSIILEQEIVSAVLNKHFIWSLSFMKGLGKIFCEISYGAQLYPKFFF